MALDTIHKKILHDHCLTRAELEEHRKNINLLTWQINNAVQFLDDLENNPKNLVKNKYHKLKKQFKAYTYKSFHQTEHTRYTLNLFDKKLEAILNPQICEYYETIPVRLLAMQRNHYSAKNYLGLLCAVQRARQQEQISFSSSEHDLKYLQNKQIARLKYAQLTGFIIECYVSAMNRPLVERDKHFITFLEARLNDLHISINGDLPDQWQTGLSCHQQFLNFVKSDIAYDALYNMSLNTFHWSETNRYNIQKQTLLNATTSTHHPFHEAAMRLVKQMDKDILLSKKNKSNGQPRYAEYTDILKGTYTLATSHSPQKKTKALEHLQKSAIVVPGAKSLPTEIMSGIFAIIGLGIFVTGIVTFPPLSIIVAGVSLNLLSYISLTLGASVFASSFYFFRQGHEHAVAKRVNKIISISKKENLDLDNEHDPNIGIKTLYNKPVIN